MRRQLLIWTSALAISAGLLSFAAPAATAAANACPTLPSAGVGFAEGDVTGLGDDSALVFAVDLETGGLRCVVPAANGSFKVPLPAVGSRNPSDGWLIIANPSPTSSLGSASRMITSASVTSPGQSVTDQDLVMQAADLSVVPYYQENAFTDPSVACLVSAETGRYAGCGLAQLRAGVPTIRLSIPAKGSYGVDVFAKASGAWIAGEYVGDPFKKGDIESVDVVLAQESLPTCPAGTTPVSGTVQRQTSQGLVPARASIEAVAQWDGSKGRFAWVGWGRSGRDGSYRVCISSDDLPPGVTLEETSVSFTVSLVEGGVSLIRPWDQGNGPLNITIPSVPQAGGTITYADDTPATPVNWTLAKMVPGKRPGELVTGPDIAYGTTDPQGGWGVAGLDDTSGTFMLSAYPRLRGFSMGKKEFQFTSAATTVNLSFSRGNFLGRLMLPSDPATPNSYAWVEVREDGQCDGKDQPQCQRFGASSDAEGYFTLDLPPGDYRAEAFPGWDEGTQQEIGSVVKTSFAVSVSDSLPPSVTCAGACSTSSGSPVVTMNTPNVTFRILRPDGEAQTTSVPRSFVQIQPRMDSSGDWPWGDGTGYDSNDSGEVKTFLESGVYRVSVYPPEGVALPSMVMIVEATVTDGKVTLTQCEPSGDSCDTAIPFTDNAWELTLMPANLTVTVRSPELLPVGGAEYSIDRVEMNQPNKASWVGGGETDASGKFLANLAETGFYRVSIRPPRGSLEDWVSRDAIFYRGDTGVCRFDPASGPTPCTPVGPYDDSIVFGIPNVSGIVLGAQGAPVTNAWIEISQPCDNGFEGCRQPFQETPGAPVNEQGKFQLNLPEDDTYFLTIWPWDTTDGSTRTMFTLRIDPGKSFTADDSLTYRLRGANVTGTVKTSTGTPATWSWVSAEQYQGTFPYGSWQWTDSGGPVNDSGEFALALDPGTYRLRAEPGPQWRGVATSTYDDSFTLISSDQTVERTITLGEPNLRGKVKMPNGSAAANAWVEVRQWDPAYSQYVWSQQVGGSGTGEDGTFGLNLPDGRWELIANPPWGDTSASRKSQRVLVCDDSIILDDERAATCADPALAGILTIELASPNVSGRVITPQGDPVSNSWIDLQAWNEQSERYEWSPDLQGVPVSDTGAFATTLPEGRYKLTANPGFGTASYSKSSREIWVSETVCRVATSPCPTDDSITPGNLTMQLGNPNVSGSVFARSGSDSPVGYSSVQVERWESGYWQWTDTWANTSQSGAFGLNIDEKGAYRLVAWPSNEYSTYARGVVYLYRDDTRLCQLGDEAMAQSASGCGSGANSIQLRIQLTAANLPGRVQDAEGHPVPQSWVEVMEPTSYGYQWVDGAGTNQQGRFAISLQPDSEPQEYRLWVNPPWQNDAGLTRTSVDVVAFSADDSIAVCRKSAWNAQAKTCLAEGRASDDTPLAITLSGGNVSGIVLNPNTFQGVGNTSASVEKWVEAPWNPGSGTYTWAWTNLWANTRSNGRFSMSIEDTGIYRISAQPPWNSQDDDLAKGSTILEVLDTTTVSGARQWCTLEDSSGNTANPFGPCTSPPSQDDSTVNVVLGKPNVSVRVVDANDVGVRNAWVSIRKSVTQDGYTYWQWIGGDNTRQGGSFNAVVDDSGSYSLEIYPPWDGATSLARFTKDFTVICPGAVNPTGCDVQGLDDTVGFPSPNVLGSVASPDDSMVLVPNSWVSVEQWNDGDPQDPNDGFYQWIDQGAATNRQGNFTMRLSEDDTYRLTAHPSWEDPDGVSTSAIVVVRSGGTVVTCVEGCVSGMKIQLRAPNLRGTVDDSGVLMTYSWVEVRNPLQNDSWVAGTGTDDQGRFAFSLEPGTYELWAFPNWNLSSKPPRSVTVTVTGSGTQTVNIDLSDVDPNISLCLNVQTVVGGTPDTANTGAVPVTTARAVIVEGDDSVSFELMPEFTTQSSPGSAPCASQAEWNLPDGWYRFTVMPNLDDSFTTANVSTWIRLDNGVVVNADDTTIPYAS